MSMGRTDGLFWLVTMVIILGVLVVAVPLRHTNYNHVIFWTRVVGGLVVFRVGMQVIWSGMRSRHRPRLWGRRRYRGARSVPSLSGAGFSGTVSAKELISAAAQKRCRFSFQVLK